VICDQIKAWPTTPNSNSALGSCADRHFAHAAAYQDPALVVWTMIPLLASNLTLLFYCRQVLSHPGHNAPPSLHAFAESLRVTLPGLDTI